MLTFFRRIRKGLLDSGATRKYLLYAIGEIALVVIGILIALQVNNWNEQRKNNIKEKYHLNQLTQNIEENILTIKDGKDWEEYLVKSCNILLHHKQNELPYHDSLNISFQASRVLPTPAYSSVAFFALHDEGLDLISSENLRQNVIKLFEVTYPEMKEYIDRTQDRIIYNHISSFYYKNFEMIDSSQIKPNNYQAIMNNPEFTNILTQNKTFAGWFSRLRLNCISESQRVLKLIKEELDKF